MALLLLLSCTEHLTSWRVVRCLCYCVCLQLYPSIMHQVDSSLPKGDIDVKIIDFGTAQLCKDGCSVAEGISGTPGTLLPWPLLLI
jgi:hypothetical protein